MEEADTPKIVKAEPGEVVLRALPEAQEDDATADGIPTYAPPRKRERGYLLDAVTWPRVFMVAYLLVSAWVLALIFYPRGGDPSPRVARVRMTRNTFATISKAMESFRKDVGRLPTTSEGLGALTKRPPGMAAWRGPYINVRTSDLLCFLVTKSSPAAKKSRDCVADDIGNG
jgi:hypothetical protein